MPSALQYYPPTMKERLGYGASIQSERIKRQVAYKKALDYYLGNQKKMLVYEDDEADLNTQINMVKMTAERTCSFLFNRIPSITTDKKIAKIKKEEKVIQKVLEDNGGLNFLTKWALRGFLAGHSFIRVKQTSNGIRLTLLQPTSVTVFWKADDVSDLLWYENVYVSGDKAYVEDTVKVSETEWRIYTYENSTTPLFNYISGVPTPISSLGYNLHDFVNGASTWRLISEVIHSSPIPPIIDTPHLPHPDDYYGLSETTTLSLQDDINRIATEINEIVSRNASPVDVLIGTDPDEVQRDSDIYTIANAGAKVTRLEMKSDLEPINNLLQNRMETYLSLCRVVLLRGEAKDLQRVTNSAVRTLFLDMLAKNTLLQDSYGASLKKLAKLILELSGDFRRYEINVSFGNSLPLDETEIANVNAIMNSMQAISKTTAMTRLNLDPTVEKEYMSEESPPEPVINETVDNTQNML